MFVFVFVSDQAVRKGPEVDLSCREGFACAPGGPGTTGIPLSDRELNVGPVSGDSNRHILVSVFGSREIIEEPVGNTLPSVALFTQIPNAPRVEGLKHIPIRI